MLSKTGELEKLNPQDYLLESELQELLAKYPALLAGDQIRPTAPRQWLLVKREARLADSLDGSGRWPIDHLFLDQEATPTFVEVKRSTDSRIRREVVGQMLDYAANAVAYLSGDQMQAWVATEAEAVGLEPDALLSQAFGDDLDPDEYWLRVKTNLQAGRIRLLFVADVIPAELRRIVEFLNEQMDPAEVLALELAQFGGGDLRTLVPRVIGLSERAQAIKSGARRPRGEWDELQAIAELEKNPMLGEIGRDLMAWVERTPGVTYRKAQRVPEIAPALMIEGRTVALMALTNEGRVYLSFPEWTTGLLADPELRRQFADDVTAAVHPVRAIRPRGWQFFEADRIADPEVRAGFLAVLSDLVSKVTQTSNG